MPKIDIAAVTAHSGSGYPPPFDAPCAARTRRRLGDAGGLRDFGVNLMTLPPGRWSGQRHWHSHEDGGKTVLHAGECACFAKCTGNGHHLINRSSGMAVYLEVGSRDLRHRRSGHAPWPPRRPTVAHGRRSNLRQSLYALFTRLAAVFPFDEALHPALASESVAVLYERSESFHTPSAATRPDIQA